MKKNQYLKKAAFVIMTGVLSASITTSVIANEKVQVVNDSSIHIAYVGNQNNLPVVEMQINGQESADYFVSVKDENGVLLYSEKLTGTKINRKYVLQSVEVTGTTFTVTNRKTNETSVYKVLLRQVKAEEYLQVIRVYSAR